MDDIKRRNNQFHDYDWLIRKQWEKRVSKRKQCCRNRNNLKYALGLNKIKDRVVLQCTVCKARHHMSLMEYGTYRGF